MSELVDTLHSQVTFYVHRFNSLVNDIDLLALQIVAPTFLMNSELSDVVKHAMHRFDLVPATPLKHLPSYYSLLDVSVVLGAVLVHVPFIDSNVYQSINVVPFPSSVTHGEVEKTVNLG